MTADSSDEEFDDGDGYGDGDSMTRGESWLGFWCGGARLVK